MESVGVRANGRNEHRRSGGADCNYRSARSRSSDHGNRRVGAPQAKTGGSTRRRQPGPDVPDAAHSTHHVHALLGDHPTSIVRRYYVFPPFLVCQTVSFLRLLK